MRKVEHLRRSLGCFGLSEDQLGWLAMEADECQIGAGETLVREGIPGPQSFVITEGHATVEVGERAVAAIGPGSIVGDIGSADRLPKTATVTADTDLRVLVLGPGSWAAVFPDGLAGRDRAETGRAKSADNGNRTHRRGVS